MECCKVCYKRKPPAEFGCRGVYADGVAMALVRDRECKACRVERKSTEHAPKRRLEIFR